MARPQTELNELRDLAEVRTIAAEASFLRRYFERAELALYQQWQVAETAEQREHLHAQQRALTEFRKGLYAECKRITDRQSR